MIDIPTQDREVAADRALPWNTAPSGQGSSECAWCGRSIYKPAVPCSVSPIEGLENIVTAPGLGDRCKYEWRTRVAD
jgi:hypothetical protein